jgi:hypothetical protein
MHKNKNPGICIIICISQYCENFLFSARGRNQSATLTQAWLGLSDRDKDGTYKWIDKHPLSYKRFVIDYCEFI